MNLIFKTSVPKFYMDKSFEAIICFRYYINSKDLEKLVFDWAIFLHFLDLYQGSFKKNQYCYRCNKTIQFNMSKYYHYTFNCIQKGDRWDLMFNRTYDFINCIDLKEGLYWRQKEIKIDEEVFEVENESKVENEVKKIKKVYNPDSVTVVIGNY